MAVAQFFFVDESKQPTNNNQNNQPTNMKTSSLKNAPSQVFTLNHDGKDVPVTIVRPTVAVRKAFAEIHLDILGKLQKINTAYDDVLSLNKLEIALDERGNPRVDSNGHVVKFTRASSYDNVILTPRTSMYNLEVSDLNSQANIAYMDVIIDWEKMLETCPELVKAAETDPTFWTENQDVENLEKIVEFFRAKARC